MVPKFRDCLHESARYLIQIFKGIRHLIFLVSESASCKLLTASSNKCRFQITHMKRHRTYFIRYVSELSIFFPIIGIIADTNVGAVGWGVEEVVGGGVGAKNFSPLPPDAIIRIPDTICRIPKAIIRVPDAICRVPDANCQVPDANCQVPDAICRVPDAICQVPEATCRLPEAICQVPEAICHIREAIYRMPETHRRCS